MMELLILLEDRGKPDPGTSQRGDVVCYQLDGFAWGKGELTMAQCRIVRLNLTQVECQALVMSVEPATREGAFQKRKYKIDLAALSVALKNSIQAARTKTGIIDARTSVALSAVRTAVVLRQ